MSTDLKAALLASLLLVVTGCTKDAAAPPSPPTAVKRSGLTFERLTPSQGVLTELIAAANTRARAAHLKPFVELRADWCGPCKELEASLTDERMVAAFAGTHIISLDVDAWGKQLGEAGLDPDEGIPAFFELDADGKPTGRKIDGGAWDDNVPANMAPLLAAFFAGK